MTTKKQRREQVAEKNARIREQERQDNLRKLRADQAKREMRKNDLERKAKGKKPKDDDIVPENLLRSLENAMGVS